jgi:membrane protein implicated in regulation of membrane protease activity
MQDISRYSEPVVWRQWSDPTPAASRLDLPDTSLDAAEIRRLAVVGTAPTLAFVGVFGGVFSWIPLAALGWALHLPMQWLTVTWAALLTAGLVYVWRVFHAETQHWLSRLDEQVAATIAVMEQRAGPRVVVGDAPAPVVQVRPVQEEWTPAQKRMHRLTFWALRAVKDASVIRHDTGEPRHLTVRATGERVGQKEQLEDYAALARMKILTKTSRGWQLANPAWTEDDVLDRLEASIGQD